MRHTWVSKVGMVMLLGVMGLAGDIYAAQPIKNTPAGGGRIVDANNKLVGPVIGVNFNPGYFSPYVVLNISVPNIMVEITPNFFRSTAGLTFGSANCSGTPFFSESEVNVAPHMFPPVGVINNIAYGPGTSPPIPNFTFNSVQNYSDGSCIVATGNIPQAVPGTLIMDLSTQFTPPYSFVYP